MSKQERGHTLIELLIALAVGGILLTLAWNAVDYARRTVALVSATSELRALFQNTRAIAIAHRRNVAIRFWQEGGSWSWRVYEDRDNDGVRNDDISRGVDVPLSPARTFQYVPARIGVPLQTIIDPTNHEPLASRLPVRFGTSQLCTFSREGESSNGSIVLTDGYNVRIIEIEGHSALIHVLRWDGSKWTTTS
ncbi:MAG TPA: GspH/FimT family pseudopilin [Thermoanaerobaculia bacterium]|jgi:prepilin-type N-terminal cleavage/methylation domain-containing protein|nr:GspH/FimT family pseudopilin [Thermoanaerobaculia bacterium]